MVGSKFAQFQSSKVQDPEFIVKRFEDKKGNRFYYRIDESNDIKIYAGITSLVSQVMPESPYLTNWKIDRGKEWGKQLDVTAKYGTLMHMIFADWFDSRFHMETLLTTAEEFCIQHGAPADMPKKDLLAFIKWVEDYEVEPLLLESMLLSAPIEGEHFCLTIDNLCYITVKEKSKQNVCVGEYKIGPKKGQPKYEEQTVTTPRRTLANVDFKSNFSGKEDHKSYYDSHKYQLFAAKDAVKYNFNADVKVIANFSPLNWRDEPSYQFTIHEIHDRDYEIYSTYMKLAKLRGLFSPSGRVLVVDQFDTSNGYRYMNYSEYIRYCESKNKPVESIHEETDFTQSEIEDPASL